MPCQYYNVIKNERYFPDSAALAQFISCCAQIVAGLYGITLAGRSGPEGSAVEFIALYDQIERQCETMLPAQVLARLRESKSNHFSYTIELLREQKLAPDPVIAERTRLYSYYACVVNCEPLSVKQEMRNRAARVLVSLQQPEQQKTQASSFAERLQQGRMLER